MALSADRIPTLFDEVVRHSQAPTLGTSIGDDGAPFATTLGASVGDDGSGAPQASLGGSVGDDLVVNQPLQSFACLGASIGDDLVPNLPLLGPSIGDDGFPGHTTLGASVGDDLAQIPGMALGPSIGDDGALSDRRLKTDIEAIGSGVLGLPLYRFRYIGQDGLYEGLMAQDVLAVRPDAVSVGADGFYRVHYARLGTACRRIG